MLRALVQKANNRAALAALLGVSVVIACQVRATRSGENCTFNSDCEPPLICTARQCRQQCREDRDCNAGATCHPAGTTARICVSPGTPLPCVLNTDCPASAACFDGACRQRCMTNAECPAGTSCATDRGVCERAIETPAADALPVDSAADASPCMTCGARCVDTMRDPNHCGGCGLACPTGTECVAGACGSACDGGVCPPPWDRCETPLEVTVGDAEPRRLLVAVPSAERLTHTARSCGTAPDVFIRVQLRRRAVVAVQGPSGGSSGMLAGPCSETVRCESMHVLDAGTHDFVVDDASGNVVIHYVPIGDLPATPLPSTSRASGAQSGSSPVTVCGASGPAHAFYFMTTSLTRFTLAGCSGGAPQLTLLRTEGAVACGSPGACSTIPAVDVGIARPQLFVAIVGGGPDARGDATLAMTGL